MRKTFVAAAVAGSFGLATAAHAIITPFDIGNGTTTFAVGQSSLDWSSDGSGVSIGNGPFGTPLQEGDTFQFLYQANLVNVNPGGIAGFPPTLDTSSDGVWAPGGYEFTIAISLYDEVDSYTVTAGQTITTANATFVRDSTQVSKISIFYDESGDGENANTATGTGFVDGTEILRMTITDGTAGFPTFSTFNAILNGPGANTGQGSTKVYAQLLEPGDFVDSDYLDGVLDFIFDIEIQSNLNYPAGSSSTTTLHAGTDASGGLYPSYTVATDDILFKVDADNQFSVVPVPGALSLLGIGLTALGAVVRRRRSV